MSFAKKNLQELEKNKYIMDFNRMRTNGSHSKLEGCCVQPYFDELEQHLVSYIEKATYVVGCVAWLTNKNITEAIENIKGAKIIINKEEYLNPDMEIGQKFFYKCLRGRYDDIPDMFTVVCTCCNKNMLQCQNFIKQFGKIESPPEKKGAILTCGIVNNFSKMHHKFLIFFNQSVEPIGIWTGSYNMSNNSNFSLENALYITDKLVVQEYIKEFLAIYPFSESYKWTSGVLCAPIY